MDNAAPREGAATTQTQRTAAVDARQVASFVRLGFLICRMRVMVTAPPPGVTAAFHVPQLTSCLVELATQPSGDTGLFFFFLVRNTFLPFI